MHIRSIALIGCFAVSSAVAQVSATVSVIQQLQLQVDNNPPATLSPGPLPSAGVVLSTGQGSTYSEFSVAPQSLPLGANGWRVSTDLRTITSGPAVGTATISGRIDIAFTSPQQTSGVLLLIPLQAWNSSTSTVVGDASVDTTCDGTPDLFGRTAGQTEIPWTVGPTASSLCIEFNVSVTTNPVSGVFVHGGAIRTWHVVFAPNVYGVEDDAVGCAGRLGTFRSPIDLSVSLLLSDPFAPGPAPTILSSALLIGTRPTALTVPVAPFCTLLIDQPVAVPPGPGSTPLVQNWDLPAGSIAPGLRIYLQGAWLGANNTVNLTDSLRTF